MGMSVTFTFQLHKNQQIYCGLSFLESSNGLTFLRNTFPFNIFEPLNNCIKKTSEASLTKL